MHERRGAERGFAGQAGIDEQASILARRHVDPAGHLHEEVMGMLAIDQREAVGGLAGGEEVWITPLAHQRIGGQHRSQREVHARADRPRGLDHRHRLDERLVASARAALPGPAAPGIAMHHQHPVAGAEMQARHPVPGW